MGYSGSVNFNHLLRYRYLSHDNFYKFLRIVPNGFECILCPKTITCSAYYISREPMHRHLESKHGIIRQGPITTEDVKNNAGYLFSCTVV